MNCRTVRLTSALVFSAAFLLLASAAQAQNDAASLFKAKCAGCHAADGSGNSPAGKAMKIRDLASPDVQKQTDAQLTDIISAGKSPMPAYKGKITDDQIKEIVAYIRGLAKK